MRKNFGFALGALLLVGGFILKGFPSKQNPPCRSLASVFQDTAELDALLAERGKNNLPPLDPYQLSGQTEKLLSEYRLLLPRILGEARLNQDYPGSQGAFRSWAVRFQNEVTATEREEAILFLRWLGKALVMKDYLSWPSHRLTYATTLKLSEREIANATAGELEVFCQ